MERVENDQKSQFFYAFAANPGFIEIPRFTDRQAGKLTLINIICYLIKLKTGSEPNFASRPQFVDLGCRQ